MKNCWFHFGKKNVPKNRQHQTVYKPIRYKINHLRDLWLFMFRSFIIPTNYWFTFYDFKIHNMRFAIIQNANGFGAVVAIVVVAWCLMPAEKKNLKEKRYTLWHTSNENSIPLNWWMWNDVPFVDKMFASASSIRYHQASQYQHSIALNTTEDESKSNWKPQQRKWFIYGFRCREIYA